MADFFYFTERVEKMKHFILVIALLLAVNLFAADTTNVAVSYIEDDYSLLYYGTATMGVAGGTDNCITQWMRIDGLDLGSNTGTLQIWCTNITGVEDIDGFIQFSNSEDSLSFQSLATDAGLNALGSAVVFDTVGVARGVRLYSAKFCRLFLDGQTSSPNSVEVNWYMSFTKPSRYSKTRLASVGDCAGL